MSDRSEFLGDLAFWVAFVAIAVALNTPDAPPRSESLRSREIRIDMIRQRIREIECGPDGLDCIG
jgi:hypothetical protein